MYVRSWCVWSEKVKLVCVEWEGVRSWCVWSGKVYVAGVCGVGK